MILYDSRQTLRDMQHECGEKNSKAQWEKKFAYFPTKFFDYTNAIMADAYKGTYYHIWWEYYEIKPTYRVNDLSLYPFIYKTYEYRRIMK